MFKDFVLPPLVLTIICVVVTSALVFTESVTTPIIEAQAKAAADAARAVVLPGAAGFEEVQLSEPIENVLDVYKATDGAGYVITAQAKGYGGAGSIQAMVGIKSSDNTIAGVEVLVNNETKGLGSRVSEPSFTEQYKGKDSTLEGVEGIGGVTISSRAMNSAVTTAYQAYGSVAGVEVAGGPERAPIEDAVKTQLFPNVTEFGRLTVEGEAYKAGDEGYIVVSSHDGFAGPVTVAVALDPNGAILSMVVTESEETEGYGAEYSLPAYIEKLVGKTSADQIETIAGASVTGEAMKANMEEIFALFPSLAAAGVEVAVETEGFGGPITVYVGLAEDGTITGVRLGEGHSETPGLGDRVTEESFTSQFIGKSSVEGIETISGASVTSGAYIKAVEQALAAKKGA